MLCFGESLMRHRLTTSAGLALCLLALPALGHPGGDATEAHAHHDTDQQPYYRGLRGDYRAGEPRWWKGNTHTHTWWSDGDSAPETVSAWYREHGYHFLVLSDHNRLQEGNIARGTLALSYTQWYPIEDESRRQALDIYLDHFGEEWVQTRTNDRGVTEVHLKTLDEFRHFFEAPGEFAFITGEEITDRYQSHPFHMNAVNIQELIEPRSGATPSEVIQNNLNAVLDQGVRSGRHVLAHINHPNFRYGITVEDILPLRYATGEGFFELYNGHHGVENYGDAHRMGLEKMWDVILSKRIAEGDAALMYGIANDDAHSFTRWEVGETSNPGRGWVMVRASRLTPDTIVSAMKQGDFYSSTGVTLSLLETSAESIALEVLAEPGVEYTIEFIGTRRGADLQGRPVPNLPEDLQGRASLRYSDDIGVVLASHRGPSASYRATGDELYVRARVTSSKAHPNPFQAGDTQMAWTQPIRISPPR